ncbi:hypothetical protein CRG98_021838 [Punica granatum]|uniref:Uncharacterized protein n=1 Tax=Punica granatum TaxID=22663 RepID=A0A2I0JNE5_PUNGR|nr:hypothetical protein CRG98_021838 [Punica granatum]
MSSFYRRLPSAAGPASFLYQPQLRRKAAGIVWLDRAHLNRRPEIALRTLTSSSGWQVRVAARESSERQQKVAPCSYAVGDSDASEGGLDRPVEVGRIWRWRVEKRTMEVAVAVAATVVLGVGNRVLYKLALVPLKQYPFFLAQLATVGYSLSPLILHFYLISIITPNQTFYSIALTASNAPRCVALAI